MSSRLATNIYSFTMKYQSSNNSISRKFHYSIFTSSSSLKLLATLHDSCGNRDKIEQPHRNMSQSSDPSTPLIPIGETKRFVTDCLKAVGTDEENAAAMGDLLAEADKRGHFSHGLNRLEMYVNDIRSGACNPNAKPEILKETAACAWVDGHNGLGVVVGNFCMDLAIEKAKQLGIGFVVAKGSNHYGIAGWYPMRAEKRGLIGFSATNTSPFLCPTRAKEAVLGTNPLSFVAPASAEDDSFFLDMATTTVAVGKIEMSKRKAAKLPDGWAMDGDGRPCSDPNAARLLYPLGGDETHSGFKGYGLATMVEIMCGVLAGSNYAHHVRKWGTTSEEANLGQTFMAIDPTFFAPGYSGRIDDLLQHLRNLEPAEENNVLVAGDPERRHEQEVLKSGVRYVKNQMENCERLAKELRVKMMRPV